MLKVGVIAMSKSDENVTQIREFVQKSGCLTIQKLANYVRSSASQYCVASVGRYMLKTT
jgi:hypothetical protein